MSHLRRTYEGWNVVTYTDAHYLQPYTPFSSRQTKDFIPVPNRRHCHAKLDPSLASALALDLNNIEVTLRILTLFGLFKEIHGHQLFSRRRYLPKCQ